MPRKPSPTPRKSSNTSGRGSGRTTARSRARSAYGSDTRYEAKTGRADGLSYVEWQKYRVVNPGMKSETWRKVGKPVRRYGPNSR